MGAHCSFCRFREARLPTLCDCALGPGRYSSHALTSERRSASRRGAELLALGQDLAFIGSGLDGTGLSEALDRAVLTDAELLEGPMAWLEYHDEFPEWDSAHRG